MLLLITRLEPPGSKFRALWFFWIIQMMLNQAANLRRKETEREGRWRQGKEGRKKGRERWREGGRKKRKIKRREGRKQRKKLNKERITFSAPLL